MDSGVYKIVNEVNSKIYIGSSKNLNNRWKEHTSSLKRNKHVNTILQRAWNKYGEDNFHFEIIEKCDEQILFEREQYYMDNLKPKYNIGIKAFGGDNLTNNPNRKEIISKITDGLYRRYSNMSDEEKEKRSNDLKGDKNPNFGNTWTKEMKEEARDRSINYFKNNTHYKKGKKHDEIFGEDRAKEISEKISDFASTRTGDKNPFFGKHHTDENKKKASERRSGKYYGEQNIPIMVDGKSYNSLGDASKDLNIPTTTIRWRILSDNINFSGYTYV